MTRLPKLAAASALSAGLLLLAGLPDLAAAPKEKEAQKYITTLKTSKDPKAKATALLELGKLGQLMKSLAAPAVPEMMTALKDPNAEVRAAAAEAIGKVDPDAKEVVPALVKLLKEDKSDEVKVGAARGLAALGSEARPAVPELRNLSKTDDQKKTKVGRAAQDAMRSINMKKAD